MKQTELTRKQLEERLDRWREMPRAPIPGGWIKALRGALGMSTTDLATRLGVSRQSVSDLERREREGTVTLEALTRAADQLDADLVYAIVPRKTLATQLEDQAERKATAEVRRVAHSMALEDQATSEVEVSRLIRERTRTLLDHGRGLWRKD